LSGWLGGPKECCISRANMVEPIELPCGVGPKNCVLDGCTHGHHLVNTVERLCTAAMSESATNDDDAAYSQITFGNLVSVIMIVV